MSIQPTVLKQGDTIGIVTLADPIDRPSVKRYFDMGVKILKEAGYELIFGQYTFDYPTTPRQRAQDFMTMFRNPKVKMILPSLGGIGSEEVLPYLDYDIIKANPKIFSGYSNLTLVVNYLTQRTGVITFHGLMASNFNPEVPYNYKQFFTMVAEPMLSPRPIVNPLGRPFIKKVAGKVTAPVMGGNLKGIANSLNTPYEIDTTNKILLLEEVSESASDIYEMLNRLKLAGKFKVCKGFMIGECTACIEERDRQIEDIIDDFLVPYGKPMLTNLSVGHGKYRMTLPLNALMELNATDSKITLIEPPVIVRSPNLVLF